jgi:hypothetical protein
MAQHSVRRGWDNQGFPQYFEYAWVIWTWSANSHTGRRPSFCRIKGRTDDSIRPRAYDDPDVFPCLKGGVHRWKAEGPFQGGPDGKLHFIAGMSY